MPSLYTTTKSVLEAVPLLHRTLLRAYQQYFSAQLWRAITMPNQQPVLIYQMGKVGSSSILASLQRHPQIHPVHVHYIFPDNVRWRQRLRRERGVPERSVMYRGIPIYNQIIRAQHPIKIITPVREPISRNISFFFQVFELYTGVSHAASQLSIAELCEIFLRENEHEVATDWFDLEFRQALGVDVYAHDFPQTPGHLRIRQGHLDVLLLKAEIPDAHKETALASFLEVPDFTLTQANISEDKAYAATYAAFKKQLILPADYLDAMLKSRYAHHFYTDAEREIIWQKWRSRHSTHAAATPANPGAV